MHYGAAMDLSKLLGSLDLDKLNDVVDMVWSNRDDLLASADFARGLPDLLAGLAQGLGDAGSQARAAAVALVGDDGASGATATLGSSAGRLGSIAEALASVGSFVADAADDVEKVPLMSGPAKKLGKAASSITGTTGDLGSLADDLVALAEVLATVGRALATLGDSLDRTGSQARAFVST